MFLNRFLLFIFLYASTVSFCQNITSKRDSSKVEELDEVIVTGQLKPQSIKKSVFEVKVITSKDIENRAGNNLADLLKMLQAENQRLMF